MPLTAPGAVNHDMSINRVRHVVVWVSRHAECTVFSTACGVTADNVHDDVVTRPDRNCDTCIPFHKTQ